MLRKNIILVGFMGTGKTTCGRLVAKRLGYEFIDMDDVIETRAGKAISSIFAEDGEATFRRMESELAVELAGREGLVIGAGGGVVLNPANLEAFDRTGTTVCLLASPDTVLQRVAGETHRPLLEDGEKAERIRALLAQRQSLYEAIPLNVQTDDQTPEEVAERILKMHNAS